MLPCGFLCRLGRSLESHNERGRILGLEARPEPGVIAEIGTGLYGFQPRQANTYVVGAGHF